MGINELPEAYQKTSDSEDKFCLYEDNIPRAIKTIKGIIQTANRFMAYLHKKMPQEIPFIKFEPISKAKLKDYHAKLKMDAEPVGKYITEDDWQIILEKLPDDIAPFIKLGYYYGLRRSETMGLETKDISTTHLNVRRQLVNMNGGKPNFAPLKNKLARMTPHWFLKPQELYELVQDGLDKKIHPDTLGTRFSNFMSDIGMNYDLHDLRRTFITKALDLNNGNATPVMMAVGHGNSAVTMLYLRDNRKLTIDVFVPTKKRIEK